MKNNKKTFVLVEGNDDTTFLKSLLTSDNGINAKEVDAIYKFQQYDGNDNSKIQEKLKTVLLSQRKNLKGVAIFLDADDDAQKTFDRLKKSFENVVQEVKNKRSNLSLDALTFPDKPGEWINTKFDEADLKIGFYIFPDNKSLGILEDIIIKKLKETKKEEIDLIENFFEGIKNKRGGNLDIGDKKLKFSKGKTQVYFSTFPFSTVGIGRYMRDIQDYDSLKDLLNPNDSVFQPIKDFICNIP